MLPNIPGLYPVSIDQSIIDQEFFNHQSNNRGINDAADDDDDEYQTEDENELWFEVSELPSPITTQPPLRHRHSNNSKSSSNLPPLASESKFCPPSRLNSRQKPSRSSTNSSIRSVVFRSRNSARRLIDLPSNSTLRNKYSNHSLLSFRERDSIYSLKSFKSCSSQDVLNFQDASDEAEWMDIDGGGAYEDLDKAEEIVKEASRLSAIDSSKALESAAKARLRYSALTEALRLPDLNSSTTTTTTSNSSCLLSIRSSYQSPNQDTSTPSAKNSHHSCQAQEDSNSLRSTSSSVDCITSEDSSHLDQTSSPAVPLFTRVCSISAHGGKPVRDINSKRTHTQDNLHEGTTKVISKAEWGLSLARPSTASRFSPDSPSVQNPLHPRWRRKPLLLRPSPPALPANEPSRRERNRQLSSLSNNSSLISLESSNLELNSSNDTNLRYRNYTNPLLGQATTSPTPTDGSRNNSSMTETSTLTSEDRTSLPEFESIIDYSAAKCGFGETLRDGEQVRYSVLAHVVPKSFEESQFERVGLSIFMEDGRAAEDGQVLNYKLVPFKEPIAGSASKKLDDLNSSVSVEILSQVGEKPGFYYSNAADDHAPFSQLPIKLDSGKSSLCNITPTTGISSRSSHNSGGEATEYPTLKSSHEVHLSKVDMELGDKKYSKSARLRRSIYSLAKYGGKSSSPSLDSRRTTEIASELLPRLDQASISDLSVSPPSTPISISHQSKDQDFTIKIGRADSQSTSTYEFDRASVGSSKDHLAPYGSDWPRLKQRSSSLQEISEEQMINRKSQQDVAETQQNVADTLKALESDTGNYRNNSIRSLDDQKTMNRLERMTFGLKKERRLVDVRRDLETEREYEKPIRLRKIKGRSKAISGPILIERSDEERVLWKMIQKS